MTDITGTGGDDSLEGGSSSDLIRGLGGDDALTDTFGGDDKLYGGTGGDSLDVTRSSGSTSRVLMDGGAGNDSLRYTDLYAGHAVRMIGGLGDDHFEIDGADRIAASGGAGQDSFYFNTFADDPQAAAMVSLGAGIDTILLSDSYNGFGAATGGRALMQVSDFTPGAGGDVVDLSEFLSSHLIDWIGQGDPFGGFLRLAQSGSDTILQIDHSGWLDDPLKWSPLLIFRDTQALDFTADNFGGYEPEVRGYAYPGSDHLVL